MTAETVKIKKSSNKDRHHAMRGKSIKWEMLEAGIFLYLKKTSNGKEHTEHLSRPCTGLSGPSVLKRAGQMPSPFRPKSADT